MTSKKTEILEYAMSQVPCLSDSHCEACNEIKAKLSAMLDQYRQEIVGEVPCDCTEGANCYNCKYTKESCMKEPCKSCNHAGRIGHGKCNWKKEGEQSKANIWTLKR